MLSRKVYRLEDHFYRNAGRRLACLREAHALQLTLNRLSQSDETDSQMSTVCAELRHVLQAAQLLTAINAERLIECEIEALHSAQKRIAALKFATDFDDPFAGVAKVYAHGRAAMLKAMRKPTSVNFHALRKQSRYLHEHLKLLLSLDQIWLKTFSEELKELESYLSELQDLAVLQHWLTKIIAQELRPLETFESLLRRLRARQSVLRALIKPLSESLYGARPGIFRQRLKTCNLRNLAPTPQA